MSQIITIDETGAISGLQHKKGYDLRALGKTNIKRISEIIFNEKEQMWQVQFLTNNFTSKNKSIAKKYLHSLDIILFDLAKQDKVIAKYLIYSETIRNKFIKKLFYDYDTAVQAEILVLDWLRLQGIF